MLSTLFTQTLSFLVMCGLNAPMKIFHQLLVVYLKLRLLVTFVVTSPPGHILQNIQKRT